jgi:hypothetical protein
MPKAKTTTTRNPRIAKGRHPMLKDGSLAHRIFVQLKMIDEPVQTPELARVLIEPHGTVASMLGKMRQEGLVRLAQIVRDYPDGPEIESGWVANKPAEQGVRRDRIEVETIVYVNEDGEYSVRSRVVGGLPTMHDGHPLPVHVVRQIVSVPKHEEMGRKRVNPLVLAGTKKLDPIVIDGELADTTPR